jgi:hypothetical protein
MLLLGPQEIGFKDIFHRQLSSLSGFKWYEFCFGTSMESGDIEVVVRQALKHINTDIIENTLTKQNM